MNTLNPVCWFDLPVANLERAKRFYETVFALTLTDMPSAYGRQSAFPADPGGTNATGALVEHAGYVAPATGTVVYFATADCEAELARVVAAGGTVVQPKTSIGEFGFVATITDTEGNTVGLYSRK